MTISDRARVTASLGCVQILTWGSSFYLLAVLGEPIAAETGWSRQAISAGVAVALLVSGLAARAVGRAIHARGGRRVLILGTLVLALGLVALATAQTLPIYILAWAIIGLGMAGTLYEAAFSTLGVLFGTQARGAITQLTLVGGFSSTLCWPLSAVLVEAFGWRGAALSYAGLHIAITLPLCALALPRHKAAPIGEEAAAPASSSSTAPLALSDRRFYGLAMIGVALGAIFSIVSIHLVTLMTAQGLALATAVGLGTLIGPAQVGARVLELLGRERHPPTLTLLAASLLVCAGIAALWAEMSAAAALIAYGAGTGLFSIARGTVPLALFGPEDYPIVMARLALPILLASALAPIVGAALIDWFGADATLACLAAVAVIPVLLTVLLMGSLRRNP